MLVWCLKNPLMYGMEWLPMVPVVWVYVCCCKRYLFLNGTNPDVKWQDDKNWRNHFYRGCGCHVWWVSVSMFNPILPPFILINRRRIFLTFFRWNFPRKTSKSSVFLKTRNRITELTVLLGIHLLGDAIIFFIPAHSCKTKKLPHSRAMVNRK